MPIALNLKAALSELIRLYGNETRQKGIEVKLISPAQNLRILSDKFLFDRIIKNLMTNAIEPMPHGGLLSITLSEDKTMHDKFVNRLGSAIISIEDTGGGILKERVDTLFTNYISTKRKGLGLGLAVTKKNVSELGGTITVESELGNGSIFTLSFPLFAVSG